MMPHTVVEIYQYTEGASCHNLCPTQCHIPEDNNLCFKYPFNVASLSYRGTNKSLAQPGRKQATATEDYDVHISYL
jgi:hypothetical protein